MKTVPSPERRLQDEALAAEEPGPEALREGHVDLHALGRAQERVALAQPAAPGIEVELLASLPG